MTGQGGKNIMGLLFNGLDRLEHGLRVLAAVCLGAMAVVTCLDIAGTVFFSVPFYGSEDIVAFLAVLTIGFSLPFAHSQGSHIGMEFLYNRLSASCRTACTAGTACLSLLLFLITGSSLLLYGRRLQASGAVSMNLELPVFMAFYVLSFCFFVLSVRVVVQFVRPFCVYSGNQAGQGS